MAKHTLGFARGKREGAERKGGERERKRERERER